MEDIAGNIERQMTQLGDEAQARDLMRFFKTLNPIIIYILICDITNIILTKFPNV